MLSARCRAPCGYASGAFQTSAIREPGSGVNIPLRTVQAHPAHPIPGDTAWRGACRADASPGRTNRFVLVNVCAQSASLVQHCVVNSCVLLSTGFFACVLTAHGVPLTRAL